MKEQIALLENDIRRATAHVKKYDDKFGKYQNDSDFVSWLIYQNILDKLEIKLQEIKNV